MSFRAITEPARLGESPLWDSSRSRLLWVDILDYTVHEFDPATGQDFAVRFEVPVSAVALRSDGGLLVAAGLGVATCDWPSGQLDWVAEVDGGVRTNDGKPDPAGRFVVGTLAAADSPGAAALYRIEGGATRPILHGVTISNGLDWSPDGDTLYYVDTPLGRVDAFDYDVTTGEIAGRRTFVDLHDVPGRPDGLTVDSQGGVWVAMARGGAAVRRFTPDGRAGEVIALPVPNVTSLAFGGDDLSDLYVTTSQLRLSPDDLRRWPLSGSLFHLTHVGVSGRPPNHYKA